MEPHPLLADLKDAVERAAAVYSVGEKRRMQRSTALVIAAYARLDAEAGGVVFHTLYKAFDIEEASTRYWIRQFRDMPTEELLASAQEQLKK